MYSNYLDTIHARIIIKHAKKTLFQAKLLFFPGVSSDKAWSEIKASAFSFFLAPLTSPSARCWNKWATNTWELSIHSKTDQQSSTVRLTTFYCEDQSKTVMGLAPHNLEQVCVRFCKTVHAQKSKQISLVKPVSIARNFNKHWMLGFI